MSEAWHHHRRTCPTLQVKGTERHIRQESVAWRVARGMVRVT